jgi:hypothetical protein
MNFLDSAAYLLLWLALTPQSLCTTSRGLHGSYSIHALHLPPLFISLHTVKCGFLFIQPEALLA